LNLSITLLLTILDGTGQFIIKKEDSELKMKDENFTTIILNRKIRYLYKGFYTEELC